MAVIGNIDGPNTLITLASGVTEIDVIDIYSEWKNWVKQGDNSKYLPAFRTVGGDPLSSIINAGSYFFCRNDYGWRIKPPEEDITIYLTGNLAAQDSSLPVINPTTGPYTAAILGLQPVTQGVTPQMKEQLEYASFVNGVWVDQTNGTPGTGYTIAGKPIGTPETPVSNFQDAVTIVTARGLPRTLYIIGNATLDTGDVVENYKIDGENAARTTLTVNAGSDTLGCEITNCKVTGNLDGGSIIKNCVIENLNYINGVVFQCMINPGTISLGGTNTAFFLDCYSGVPGPNTPIIDMNGVNDTGVTPLAMRNYSGGIKIIEKTGPCDCSIDLSSGEVIIDSTCVNGSMTIRGDGKVIDSLGNHLTTGTINGGLALTNEANFGDHVHDIWQTMGLDENNPMTVTPTSRSAGNVSQTISGDGVTTTTVTRN